MKKVSGGEIKINLEFTYWKIEDLVKEFMQKLTILECATLCLIVGYMTCEHCVNAN
jgi:hypothetical protein